MRARVESLKDRADRVAQRAQLERTRHGSIDAAFEMVDHDSQVGGDIMAGALAYRLFIWLLPLAFVAVAGLGIAADASSESPEKAAHSVGLAGLVSSSVANASESSARWYAIVIGVPILLYATRSVLRAVIVVHRLVWRDTRQAAPKPTVTGTLLFLGALLGFIVIAAIASEVRGSSLTAGLIATILIAIPNGALWLFLSLRLPHRTAGWRDLLPGAVLFTVGIELVHLVSAYFIAPEAAKKQGTYGSLGLAAALLLGLFIVSRLIVATAVLNATLWSRRTQDVNARER